jgi:DNA mismatch repair protein MutS
MNRCRTPMGKRLLREWLVRPLTDLDELQQRRDVVSLLFSDDARLESLQSLLSACRDVERAIVRLSFNSGGPRDLGALRDTLLVSSDLASLCDCDVLRRRQPDMSELSNLGRRLDDALEDELPRSLAQGRLVRDGYSAELDFNAICRRECRSVAFEYLEKERKAVGLPKLKAGNNRVFGYYLELASPRMRAFRTVRAQQTLVNCERYVTAELKEYESRSFRRRDDPSLEDAIWKDLTGNALEHIAAVQQFGRFIASLDVLCSFAQVARERRYVCPVLTTAVTSGSRRTTSVVEAAFSEDVFVPNDVTLETDVETDRDSTGPNMAGKSTYLRMTALLCLLAQVGSFSLRNRPRSASRSNFHAHRRTG